MRTIWTAGSAVVFALLWCGGCGSKPEPTPPIAPQPQSTVELKNPSELNAGSIEQGKTLYHSTDCALCHGKEGDGKGFEAKDAHMNVHDWRNSDYNKSFTDGKLYDIIANGKGLMPAYATRETPDQIWLMVDYIRSMSMTPSPK